MNMVVEQYLTEARRDAEDGEEYGGKANFKYLARMAVMAIKHTLENGDFPKPISASELQLGVLGGKLKGRLKGVGGSDQEEIVQKSVMAFIAAMPRMLAAGSYAKADEHTPIDVNDFGSYISANFQNRVGWALQDHWRQQSRRMPTMTDISGGDDKNIPEPSTEDRPESAVKPERISLGRKAWDRATNLVIGVENMLRTEIEEIRSTQGTRIKTAQREGRADNLKTTIAMMQNLPRQMAQQMSRPEEDEDDGYDFTSSYEGMPQDAPVQTPTEDEEDRVVGDDKIYHRLRLMVRDPESRLDAADRELIAPWAGKPGSKSGGNDHAHRKIIATALWVANGGKGEDKPAKALDANDWFYDYALDYLDANG